GARGRAHSWRRVAAFRRHGGELRANSQPLPLSQRRSPQRARDAVMHGNHGMALYAAARVASVRPNTRSSRSRSTDDPERISSRYQGPSAISPNSTAPMRQPLAMTSFL